MKSIHWFKPDFKYLSLIKKEWISASEISEINDDVFEIISFRKVVNMKVINEEKGFLMKKYNIEQKDIVSETILEEEFSVPDGLFIISKVKRKVQVVDNNFFFLRDVASLISKYYFDYDV